jgi:hypothetical protein
MKTPELVKPNLSTLVSPTTPVKKVIADIDRFIDLRKQRNCERPTATVYAEAYDVYDKAIKKESKGAQSLESHAHNGIQILRGEYRRKQRARRTKGKKRSPPCLTQQGMDF